jgi:hypothetical protein
MGGTLAPLARIEAPACNARSRAVAYRRGSGCNSNQPSPGAIQRSAPRIHVSCLTSQGASGRNGRPLAFSFIDCKTGKTLRVIPIMQVFWATPAWSSRPRTFRALRFQNSSRFSCPTVFPQQHGSLAVLGVECWLRARKTARWDSRVDE